jgi:hypothetical protein
VPPHPTTVSHSNCTSYPSIARTAVLTLRPSENPVPSRAGSGCSRTLTRCAELATQHGGDDPGEDEAPHQTQRGGAAKNGDEDTIRCLHRGGAWTGSESSCWCKPAPGKGSSTGSSSRKDDDVGQAGPLPAAPVVRPSRDGSSDACPFPDTESCWGHRLVSRKG